jgi:hypothetical protein
MSETRIPRASQARWSSLQTKEEKDKYVQQYKAWKSNQFTKEFLEHMSQTLEAESVNQDKETGFLSLFQFRFSEAVARGRRSVLRELIKII